MDIETNNYRSFASQIHQCRIYPLFTHHSLNTRHVEILNAIESLRQYFIRLANQSEELEHKLPTTTTKTSLSFLSASSSFDPHLSALLRKGKNPIEGSASCSYSYLTVENTYKSDYFKQINEVNVGNAEISGEFELGLWSNRRFDPHMELHAQAGASLLHFSSESKVGTNDLYGKLDTDIHVGSAQISSDIVLSAQEQTIDVSAHVAAAEGEASLVFYAFGASITLSGSASIGSAGLDMSYSHKNREWEIGSKLGFIAGLGWNVKVNY